MAWNTSSRAWDASMLAWGSRPGGHGPVMGSGSCGPGTGGGPSPAGPPGAGQQSRLLWGPCSGSLLPHAPASWTPAWQTPGGGGVLLPGDHTRHAHHTRLQALGVLLLHLRGGRHLPLHLQKLLQVGAGLRVDNLKVDPERHRGPGGIGRQLMPRTAGPGPTHGQAPRGTAEPWDGPSGVGRGARHGRCWAAVSGLPREVQQLADHSTLLSSTDPGSDGLGCPRSWPLWAL